MRRGWLVRAVAAVAICLAAVGPVFASGVALTGVGARATALGGCYRGISDDWSAAFWNPAGLTQIMGYQTGASFELIMPTTRYKPATWNGAAFSAVRAGETENEPQSFFVPSGGLAYGLENVALGLGVFQAFGLGSKWDLLDTDTYNGAYPSLDYEGKLQVLSVQPTFAYFVGEKLSLGLGVGLVHADILIRRPVFTPNPYLVDPRLLDFKNQALVPLGGASPAFNHLLTETKLEGNGLTFSGCLGLMFRPTDDLQIGLAGRFYADAALDGKANAITYFATNPACHQAIETNLKPTLDGMLQGGLITQEQYATLLYYYSGGSNVKYDNLDAEADLPLPMNIGIGLAYFGIENVVATFDVDWTQWSSWDVIEVELPGGAKTQLVEKWEDTIRIGAGLEYSLDPLKLRAGFFTDPAAVPDETMTATIPDVGRRNVLSLGAAYVLGDVALSAAYKYSIISDRNISQWQENADRNLGYDNLAGLYKLDAHNLMLGLTYNF